MKVVEIGKKTKNTLPPAEREKRIKEMRAADDKIVSGMFEFIDAQGGFLEFSYRRFPGESIKTITLTHGEICDLPMGMIKHLNNTRKKVRRYSQEIPEAGNKPLRTYETISRVRFTRMDVL